MVSTAPDVVTACLVSTASLPTPYASSGTRPTLTDVVPFPLEAQEPRGRWSQAPSPGAPSRLHELGKVMMDDWFDAGGNGSACDVVALFDSEAAGLLLGVISAGALVSLGTTSDGGALGVTITVDGRWRREYFRDSESLTDWLEGAAEPVRLAVEASRASAGRGNGSRRRRGL
jgi:hypothetical protein